MSTKYMQVGVHRWDKSFRRYKKLQERENAGNNHFFSFPPTVHCFGNVYAGKQPMTWKEYCVKYWLKELQESMDSALAAAIQLKYC